MSLASDEDIEDFVADLKEVFGDRLENVLLFGSYAKGDYVPGSDIDLLVLMEDEVEKEGRDRAGDLTARYFEKRDLFFSPTLMNVEEFENKKKEGYSFHQEVSEQGVEV